MAGSEAAIHKTANLWVSRIIPLLLIGIVGYVTWVVIVLICVDYLLKPPSDIHIAPRHGVAITVLTLYSIFLFLMAWPYFRLLYTIFTDPGYTARGPEWRNQQRTKQGGKQAVEEKAAEESSGSSEKMTGVAYPPPSDQDGPSTTQSAPCLINFITRDVFVCKGDGRPRWCSQCLNWKSDRTRHCREVDRCVRKMDHFCPWVGGVISENSFKFFIQFTSWTAVFCFFNLVVIAMYLAESRRVNGTVNIHWLVSVSFAGLFFLFSLGMSGSSIQLILLNVTTIENLSRKSIVWDLAIYMPKPPQQPPTFPTISFSPIQVAPQIETQNATTPSDAIRTYAILHSKPGENPWDLGVLRNFQSVMGDHWYDWLFPVKRSPCCDHSSEECQYEVGSVVDRMRKEAGIDPPRREEESDSEEGQVRRSRRRRRRRKRTPRGDTPMGVVDLSKDEEVGPVDASDLV